MDFILGIFTGISITILWGHYLNEKRKKQRGVPKHRNPPDPPQGGQLGIYIDGKFIVAATPFLYPEPYIYPPYPVTTITTLEQKLQDAIAREDFKEAARLRDLINRK